MNPALFFSKICLWKCNSISCWLATWLVLYEHTHGALYFCMPCYKVHLFWEMAKDFMDLSVIVLDTDFILIGTRLWRESTKKKWPGYRHTRILHWRTPWVWVFLCNSLPREDLLVIASTHYDSYLNVCWKEFVTCH